MATTIRSSLKRILRGATSHRNPTIPLRPHHNLHRHYHTSPASFLHSNPSNLRFWKPHLCYTSTFQTRATALQNPLSPYSISNPSHLQISKPRLISTITSRHVHTRATRLPRNRRSIWPYATAFGLISTGLILIYKFQEKPFQGLKGTITATELRIRAAFPGLFRKGHSVVVEGVRRPVTDECWEYYLSVTEVLAKPKQVNAAIERNHNIMASKLRVADKEKLKFANEKPRVADKDKKKVAIEYLQVAEGAERKAMLDWYTNPSNAVKSQGNVYEFALYPKTEAQLTRLLEHKLVRFEGLSDLLQEGNSVFIKVFETLITDEIREYKSDEILEDKLADFNKDKLTKSFTVKDEDMEYHISVEVLTKHDYKYMPKF